jgi:hypothetical protein
MDFICCHSNQLCVCCGAAAASCCARVTPVTGRPAGFASHAQLGSTWHDSTLPIDKAVSPLSCQSDLITHPCGIVSSAAAPATPMHRLLLSPLRGPTVPFGTGCGAATLGVGDMTALPPLDDGDCLSVALDPFGALIRRSPAAIALATALTRDRATTAVRTGRRVAPAARGGRRRRRGSAPRGPQPQGAAHRRRPRRGRRRRGGRSPPVPLGVPRGRLAAAPCACLPPYGPAAGPCCCFLTNPESARHCFPWRLVWLHRRLSCR